VEFYKGAPLWLAADLPAKIRLGKRMEVANSLAYFDTGTITAVKSFKYRPLLLVL